MSNERAKRYFLEFAQTLVSEREQRVQSLWKWKWLRPDLYWKAVGDWRHAQVIESRILRWIEDTEKRT